MNWEIAGYAALMAFGGFIFSIWNHVKAFLQQISSFVIVEVEINTVPLTMGTLRFFQTEGKLLSFSKRIYRSEQLYSIPRQEFCQVAGEIPTCESSFYLYRGRLFWLKYMGRSILTVSGIRGTFSPDEIVDKARESFERWRKGFDATNHFMVKYYHGTHRTLKMNPLAALEKNNNKQAPNQSRWYEDIDKEDFLYVARLLGAEKQDLSTSSRSRNALDSMVLTPLHRELLSEFELWYKSKTKYLEKGIPWRRGWQFEGPPGTGKSLFARALAEKFDLPLLLFDLSTMNNEEFHDSFGDIMQWLPAVLLFEDFDSVFEDRKNISGSDLTFDCLINHLDGVEQFEGLFFILTTNYPDKISTAISDRPGRIDRRIVFEPFDLQARISMARKILGGSPRAEIIARESADVPAASFQEKCFQELARESLGC